MRRILSIIVLVLLLSSCTFGSPAELTAPPRSTPYQVSQNAKVKQLIADWQTQVPEEMRRDAVKPETIKETIYQSTASLTEINDFYAKLSEQGWTRVTRMPGLQGQVLLAGYTHGVTTLVVGAVDTAVFGGSGVVIYTVVGNK